MAGTHGRPELVGLHDHQLLHLDERVVRGCYCVMYKFAQVRLQTVGGCHLKGSGGTNPLNGCVITCHNKKHKTVRQCCVHQHSQFSGHSGWIHWTLDLQMDAKMENKTGYPADDRWLVDSLYSASPEGWDGWYTGSLSLLGVAVGFCCWPMSWWSLMLSFGLIPCIDDSYLPASEKFCWRRWRHFKRKE